MAWLSHADQSGLPLPRLDSRGADRARPGAVPRSGPTCRNARHPGVAKFLLQVTHDGTKALSGARPVHPANEAEEYAAVDDGRRSDHAPRPGILRLARILWARWLFPLAGLKINQCGKEKS